MCLNYFEEMWRTQMFKIRSKVSQIFSEGAEEAQQELDQPLELSCSVKKLRMVSVKGQRPGNLFIYLSVCSRRGDTVQRDVASS